MFTNNLFMVAVSCDTNNKEAVENFNYLYARYRILYDCIEATSGCFKNIERSICLMSNIPIINLVKKYAKDFSLDIKKELIDISGEIKQWLSAKQIHEWIINNGEDKNTVEGITDIKTSADNTKQYFYVMFSFGKWMNSKAKYITANDFAEIYYTLLKIPNIELEYIHLCPELNIKTKTDVCGEFFPEEYVYYQTSTNVYSTYVKEKDFISFFKDGTKSKFSSVEEIENHYKNKSDFVAGELEIVM